MNGDGVGCCVEHPECQENEIWISNVSNPLVPTIHLVNEGFFTEAPEFESIPFKTRRLGKVAYDTTGNKLEECSPVFAKKSELLSAGIPFDDPFGIRKLFPFLYD